MTPHRHVPRAQEVESAVDSMLRKLQEPNNGFVSMEDAKLPVERAAEDLRVVAVPQMRPPICVHWWVNDGDDASDYCDNCGKLRDDMHKPFAHPAPAPREISDSACRAFVLAAMGLPEWSSFRVDEDMVAIARYALRQIDAAKAGAR